MNRKYSLKTIRFKIPSARNHFCEMSKITGGYKLSFFNEEKKMKMINITEAQIDRETLRKLAVNVGIEFYALTGPYDVADEILRQWHKNFEKKGLLNRLFNR